MNNMDSILPTLLTLVRGQDVGSLSMLPILVKGQGIRRQGVKFLREKERKKKSTTEKNKKVVLRNGRQSVVVITQSERNF